MRATKPRAGGRLLPGLLVLATLVAGCSDAPAPTDPQAALGPVGALSHHGRWLTDETGRVVLLHGTNFVQKFPPVPPADAGFGADDAAYLAAQGFNVVRLGAVFGAIMPEPGVLDAGYVESVAGTARLLAAERIYVLLDFHQDGYGPLVHGNGFPEWATLTDGLPNPPEPFPAYYITNPALQRAFDNFWENRPGPDGVPLQEHYATAVQAVAAAVADEPRILGYDLMNEPWPGTVYQPCQTGCPDIEQARLVPFGERMAAAIRAVDAERLVFIEPFALFNFGRAQTSLSGIGAPQSGLSFHVYALSPELDEAVIESAIAASARGDAIVATEFGATNDPAAITRSTSALDERLVPWIFWTWDEHLIVDKREPPTPDNVRTQVLDALARPYASATSGTPVSFAYDAASGTYEYSWSTARPDGTSSPAGLPTTVVLPPAAYPDGYAVEVEGGRVVSEPCGRPLAIASDGGAATVRVRVTRAASCAG